MPSLPDGDALRTFIELLSVYRPGEILALLLEALKEEVKELHTQNLDPDIIAEEERFIPILQDAVDRAKRERLL